jgi:hypothetical protein
MGWHPRCWLDSLGCKLSLFVFFFVLPLSDFHFAELCFHKMAWTQYLFFFLKLNKLSGTLNELHISKIISGHGMELKEENSASQLMTTKYMKQLTIL